MAKRKAPKSAFKKDDPRINRKGPPRLDPIIKQIRELEKSELTLSFSEMLRMLKPQIKAVVENPKTCIKDLGIAKAIVKWLETGDFRYIQPYIEYIFGKPLQTIAGKDGERIQIDMTMKYEN